MIGIYFSGTGNTKYCIEEFAHAYDDKIELFPLDTSVDVEKIRLHRDIIFAYPIYYSNLPKIVSDFIKQHSFLWKDKHIFIIATMGLFSGDGAGVGARLLRKHGAHITGGLHLKMPDCICDINLLKRSYEQNRKIIYEARRKIRSAATDFKKQTPPKEGLNILYYIAGLLGQRLWSWTKTLDYYDRVSIDTSACTGCGSCISACPMKNLYLSKGKAKASTHCTLCYRCANQCPRKAITILGRRVVSQYRIHDLI